MAEQTLIVVDTNVLVNLATPVVDGRPTAPSGEDPLATLLTGYDVHVPASVIGEISDLTRDDDLLAAAGSAVLKASHHLTTHSVERERAGPLEYGLDTGETHAVWLANELEAEMFVTDEFNTTNYLFVSLALEDRNILYTTPHILCLLADRGILDTGYVAEALTYYVETKDWDEAYVARLRDLFLGE